MQSSLCLQLCVLVFAVVAVVFVCVIVGGGGGVGGLLLLVGFVLGFLWVVFRLVLWRTTCPG